MPQNLRGLYIKFEHDRPADWDFLARWQPSVVRLMVDGSHTDPASISIDKIQRLYDTTGAQILIRCWDVDDRRGDGNPGVYGELQADPHGCATSYHDFWRRFMDRLPAALRPHVLAGSINEPHPDLFPQTFTFTDDLLRYGTRDGVRYGVFMFSVGTPPLPDENRPFGWQKFATLDDAIADGNHAAVVHEYMQPEGMYAVWTDHEVQAQPDDGGRERRDYGYLIGRHLSSGLIRAPIIIGEWGIEGLIYNRYPDPAHGGHAGWRHFPEIWGPERYADEYVECIRVAAPNVVAICPFGSDLPDPRHTWDSFDVLPAYGALLSRKQACERPDSIAPSHSLHIPLAAVGDGAGIVPDPPPTTEDPEPQPAPQYPADFLRAVGWVLGEEGGYTADDEGAPANFGINQAANPDIDVTNLTRDQAIAIYYERYWEAAQCGAEDWPLCLLLFDSAVQHGVGRTGIIETEAWRLTNLENTDLAGLLAFQGKRQLFYAQINEDSWQRNGRAWMRRMGQLLWFAAQETH